MSSTSAKLLFAFITLSSIGSYLASITMPNRPYLLCAIVLLGLSTIMCGMIFGLLLSDCMDDCGGDEQCSENNKSTNKEQCSKSTMPCQAAELLPIENVTECEGAASGSPAV